MGRVTCRVSRQRLGYSGPDAGGTVAVAAVEEAELAVLLADVRVRDHLAFPAVPLRLEGEVLLGLTALPVETVGADRFADGIGGEAGADAGVDGPPLLRRLPDVERNDGGVFVGHLGPALQDDALV